MCPVVIVGGDNEVIYKYISEVYKGSGSIETIVYICIGRSKKFIFEGVGCEMDFFYKRGNDVMRNLGGGTEKNGDSHNSIWRKFGTTIRV